MNASVRSCFVLTLFMLVMLASTFARAELSATALRFTGAKNEANIEIEFNAEPQVQLRLLVNPHRLVIDLPETLLAFDKALQPRDGLITSFRAGLMQEGRSRIILAANGPFSIGEPLLKHAADGQHFVFSVTLKATDDAAFQQAFADQMISTASTTGGKGDRVIQSALDNQPFTVVIDAGHGGIDGGATGIHGTIEKEVTLDFANDLAGILRADPRLRVFLTRTKDQFISLDERVKLGRQFNGDLFISIHADTISDKSLRGATVYTLSDKASDQVAQAVASQENLSDVIGGVDLKVEDHAVADILIDLTRRETMQYSIGFARSIVDALKGKTKLINNSHRSAGFRVLRAADIPSVLVELGYLSNEDDEKLIKDAQWRRMVAMELAVAIKAQAAATLVARQ